MPVSNEQLLDEVDEILASMPDRAVFGHGTPEVVSWLGSASSLIRRWNSSDGVTAQACIRTITDRDPHARHTAHLQLVSLLNQTRRDLMRETASPTSVAVAAGASHQYFEGIRKIISLAKIDLLFADPYLDAVFVSKYLALVSSGVIVRLLTSKERTTLPTLLPAAKAFVDEHHSSIEVRVPPATFHDRVIFVDKTACHLSGTSFKDGVRKSPSILVQVMDAFPAMQKTYETMWDSATPQKL